MLSPQTPALILSLATAALLAGSNAPASAALLHIPDGFSSIQSALDAAHSGDILVVDGSASPFAEAISIDTDRLSFITLTARPGGPPPVIVGDGTRDPIVTIDATAGSPATVRISDISIDGLDERRYGIRGYTADGTDDEVILDLQLRSIAVQRCRIGVHIGTRTGTFRCDDKWGAVSEPLLWQARSRVTMQGCSIVNCLADGANLYRCTGGIYDTMIGFNGDEGVHTTASQDFVVQHSVIVKNANVGFHFQLGDNVLFQNNIVLGTTDPGYGLSLEGMQGSEPLRVHNNVFCWQDASGLKVNPVVSRLANGSCEGVPVVVDARNNIFANNGVGTTDDTSREDLDYRDLEVPGTRLFARHNSFDESADDASNVALDNTNHFGVDPAFTGAVQADELPVMAPQAFHAYDAAWAMLSGFALEDHSEAIDAGEPNSNFEDAGGLAKGSVLNDVGAFGGPDSDWGI